MPAEESVGFAWVGIDLAPGTLRPGERVLHHWPCPSGVALLTNLRIVLASHPHPTHRLVLWERDLEAIGSFAVQKTPDVFVPQIFFGRPVSQLSASAVGGTSDLSGYYAVVVDERMVFVGYVNHCVTIQGWIDETWVSRREALGWPPRAPQGPASAAPEL